MALTKAQIIVYDQNNKAVDPPIDVQFNPKELKIEKSVPYHWRLHENKDHEEAVFTGGYSESMSVSLFFDTWDSDEKGQMKFSTDADVKDVRELTKKIENLSRRDPAQHVPPRIGFHWGKFTFDPAVITSLQTRYVMFSQAGTPVRAIMDLQLKMSLTTEEAETEKSGSLGENQSPDLAKLRVLKRGETLQKIAAIEYNDPGEWRRIADANGIENPLDVSPGTKLIIPPILKL